MACGRCATALAAAPGAARSAATLSAVPLKPAGFAGNTTSSSVSLAIGCPLSVPSLARRSVSLRPIMPAAPVMRICTPLLRTCLVGADVMLPLLRVAAEQRVELGIRYRAGEAVEPALLGDFAGGAHYGGPGDACQRATDADAAHAHLGDI